MMNPCLMCTGGLASKCKIHQGSNETPWFFNGMGLVSWRSYSRMRPSTMTFILYFCLSTCHPPLIRVTVNILCWMGPHATLVSVSLGGLILWHKLLKGLTWKLVRPEPYWSHVGPYKLAIKGVQHLLNIQAQSCHSRHLELFGLNLAPELRSHNSD